MKFTGERYIPAEQGKIRLEHYHRYAIALDVVKDKDVLDVACGEGYGSSIMADVARSVVGVDISVDAVQHATATYTKPNLTFCQGSAAALGFADASFDVVVSFETIEHLAEQAQMLAEIRRVLRPDGLLVISSPNRPVYSEESGEHNEFHVKELDFKEFDELLKTQFQSIQYFGQRILMGSVIQPLEGGQGSFRAWHDDGNDLKPIAGHLAEPVYFVAVCGASSVDLPNLDMSVLYPDKLDLLKHYVGFAKWAQAQDRIVAERDERVANLSQAVMERDARIASQHQSITELEAQLASLNQVATKWDRRIASLDQRVAERDRRIASLDQRVVERDRRIASLDQRVAESDRRIACLDQRVVERDRRIASLDQRVVERDRRIASLNQVVTELDGQIGSLNHTVNKRNDKIIARFNLIWRSRIFNRSLIERLVPSNRVKRIIAEQTELITGSNVFISAWYLEQNPDVTEAGINSLAHYLSKGAVEGRNPNPLFNSRWYLEQNPDVAEAGINPLVHYLSKGAAEGRNPNFLFDSRWYLEQNPDVAEAEINPLVHYLSNAAIEGRNPSPLFDSRWYLEQNPDVAAAGVNPLAHYLSKGAAEGRNPNPWFDSRWYLEQNPDVAAAGLNPLAHYLSRGAAEGRNPNPLFDSRWYLEQNPDVAEAGLNPLVHFIRSGAEEGRQPKPQPFRDMKILCEHLLRINRKQFGLLGFESFDTPKVSIIIPVYNQVHYTLQCLESICRYLPLSAFEIIVVDDCSSDDTTKSLSSIEGVKVVSNQTNQGFVRSCNIGAKAARGEYLHFLNNDTEVTAGWLDELVRTFQEFPGTGFVGSKLVYPDGSLQEAGGIIWQDGSAWNFGRFQDPRLPIYNYAREVDYCSGASIMVPKLLFDELGGFDEHYLPAYCEDCDLALKIRDLNYRVIYQPLSVVIHYEGVTSGTDLTKGVKAYQVENTAKLFVRWQERFRAHQAPGVDVDQAKDRMAKRRVLVLDACTPTPNQDAGSIVTFNMLLLLREMNFQVTFIPEHNLLYLPDYTPALQRAGIEVLYAPYVTSVEQHLNEFGERYDLALLFRAEVLENNIKLVRRYCPHAKVLFHTVDLHFLRMSREAALLSDSVKMIEAAKMKQRELAAICLADASIVVSTAELELLRPELPNGQIHVLPLIMDVRGTSKTFSDRRDIIFVGGYQHLPNVDAVQYFVTEVMPLLRARLPGVCFNVAGSNPPDEIQALACEDVIVLGFVDDLNRLLDKMRISVAPLRFGAGIKGKIGSAMSVGLPVVATSLAAEGMSLIKDENILVADGAEAFADTVAKLYKDEALWNRISHNGLEFTENAWGAEAAWKILNEILAEISITTTRGAYPLSLCSGSEPAQKEIKNRSNELTAITSVKTRENFILALDSDLLKQIRGVEKTLIESSTNEAFAVDGYCVPCRKKVSFLVDMQSGGQRQDDGWLPNWRERLECPVCRMNNRQRLIATLIEQELDVDDKKSVYFMEQVTPIYNWATAVFKNHNIVGSEYLGYEYEGGAIIQGIRHEDVENLSFADDTLDLVVSNDVFEHVPHPARAFSECVRVLKAGGVLLATIPFHSDNDLSIIRAKLINGQLEHLLPPAYHGNPVSADGSLVFTDFGWDMLKEMQEAGFSDVSIEVYASVEFGHLGGGQLVFRLTK